MESIFRQGLDETCFEVIIVNDGSTDHSMEVIQDIISQHSNITVINQENLSLSVARNKGIAAAKGEYILMPDSDDLLVEGSLKPLLEKALETKADMVIADYVKIFADAPPSGKEIQHESFQCIQKEGKAIFLDLLDPYSCQVWRTLYRREFLVKNNLIFIPGIYYQDIPFSYECYLRARKCIKASWLLNIYRRERKGAHTTTFRNRNAHDYITSISKTWELRKRINLSPVLFTKFELNVYNSFNWFVFSVLHSSKNHTERVDAMKRLHKQSPDLRFTYALRPRMESTLLHWSPSLFISIRYLFWKWHKFRE
jgi:glycosyltransferase involved in cell wall biosynthesis